MKKYIVGIIAGVALPVLVFAQTGGLTQSQIDAIIGLVRSFGADSAVLQNVEDSLYGRTPSATVNTGSQTEKFCYTFTSNLRVGSRGAAVDALVNALVLERVLGNPTGERIYGEDFNDDVAAAVVEFQTKYGIQKTGTVGPITRAKLNALYGCGNSTQFSLSSKSVETKNGTDVLYTVNLSTASQRSSGSWTLSLSCPVGITAVTQIRGGLGCGDIAKISSGSTVEVLFNNSTNVSQTIGATAQLLSGKDDTTPTC